MKARQRGFTLVEVLVATVILAFGLLGIAGMQLSGVRASQSSYLRSQATTILTDMAEKMHANEPGTWAGQYAGFDSNAQSCATPPTICAQEYGGSSPGSCSPAALAAYDKFVVTCGVPNGTGRVGKLTDLLPQGQITIVCRDTAGAAQTGAACQAGFRHVITVFWQDRGDIYQGSTTPGAPVTMNVTMTVQM